MLNNIFDALSETSSEKLGGWQF